MTDSTSDPKAIAPKSLARITVAWWFLFLVVSVVAVVFRFSHHDVALRTPDERVYINLATRLAGSGVQGIRALVENYNKDERQWIYPPPFRVGGIFLVAGVMKLSGASAERAAVFVSSAFSVFGFLALAWLGLRFFERWAVLIGLALLSVNPLDLAIAQRAWQDSVWGGTGLLLFYFCLEASVSPRPRPWRICFWVVAVYFLLIKESGIIVYGSCVLWLVGSTWVREHSLPKCARVALMSALAAAASLAILAWCAGSVSALVEISHHTAISQVVNDYVHRYQRGPWHSFLTGFWVMSPITSLLCVVGSVAVTAPVGSTFIVVRPDRRQRQAGRAMLFLIFALFLALTIPENLKNLRYVSILFGPCCLLGGIGGMHLLALAKRRLPGSGYRLALGAMGIVLSLTCFMDYRRFERVFVRYALDDLAVVRVVNFALAAGSNAEEAPPEIVASTNAVFGREASRVPPSPEDYLSRSKKSYDQGFYTDAIKAAEEALKLRPAFAEAWNDIGAANNQLGRYEEAAAACEKALQLKPDFELARNNLQYARQMMKGQSKQ